MSGATVLTLENADDSIDISELSSGMYIVNIKHSLGEVSIRFTKR
jgi:hypothetical protein